MSVRSVREDAEAMAKVEGQKEQLNAINTKINDIVARCKLIDSFRADETKFAAKYGLAELEARSKNVYEAFDAIKSQRSETAEL